MFYHLKTDAVQILYTCKYLSTKLNTVGTLIRKKCIVMDTHLRWRSTANYKNLCMVCLFKFYTLKYLQSVLLYYIVEQASCYYHRKFHSETVFLRKDIAPNK